MIRAATYPEDVVAISRVYHAAFAEPPYNETKTFAESRSVIAGLMRTAGFLGVVKLTPSKEVVGFVTGYPAMNHREILTTGAVDIGRCFYLAEFAVAAAYRGKGVGADLHAAWLHRIDRRAFEFVLLNAWSNVEPALRFYQNRGYVSVNQRGHIFTLRLAL